MYMDDLRFALRLWRKSPGTAAVVLLSLTLGIGANATIFTFVKERAREHGRQMDSLRSPF